MLIDVNELFSIEYKKIKYFFFFYLVKKTNITLIIFYQDVYEKALRKAYV